MDSGERDGQSAGWLRLGQATIHLERRQLVRDGEPVQVSWRAFEALCRLIEANNEVVTRTDLFTRLWPGLHVEDSSLNHCIAQLRRGLGEEIIETVPRIGYRLIELPVLLPSDKKDPVAEETAIVTALPDPPGVARTQTRAWVVWVAVCLALVMGGAGLKKYFDRQARRDEARRLTQEATMMEHWGNFGDITGAMERLNKAMALDPSSALVHARIAETMLRAGQTDPGQERIEAERSVRMDPGCGECQAILGWILFSREWKWQEAADHLRRANQLNPQDAYAHLWYSQLLAATGRLPEALGEVDRAIQLEPWNHAHVAMKGGLLYFSRQYDASIAQCRMALGLNPLYPAASDWLFKNYLMKKRYEEAARATISADSVYAGLSPDADESHASEMLGVLRKGGIAAASRRFLEVLGGPQTRFRRYDRAIWRMQMGDDSGATEELWDGLSFRPYFMVFLRVDPMFERLHGQKRFDMLLAKIGLPADQDRR
jgi:DNA-binding winged helix-turn-helix (wHTH) protein/tetratricopeptide (TPR) repeat protein